VIQEKHNIHLKKKRMGPRGEPSLPYSNCEAFKTQYKEKDGSKGEKGLKDPMQGRLFFVHNHLTQETIFKKPKHGGGQPTRQFNDTKHKNETKGFFRKKGDRPTP